MPSPLRYPDGSYPKNLTDWVELDYFRRPRRSPWRWPAVLAGALLAALAVAAWGFLPGRRTAFQAGPVSGAHALFNHDCRQCHQESFQTLTRFLTHDASVTAVPDAACSRCHPGPPHHGDKASSAHCASCHREHRGRAALVGAGDQHCLVCHRDLKHTVRPGSATHLADVAGFASAHPDFARRWAGAPADPGAVRFNHRLHLNPDEMLVVDPKKVEQQWAGSPEVDPRQRRSLLKDAHLDCSSCHEPDDTGRSMKPIRYEQHCRQCHPLTVRVAAAGSTPAAAAALKTFSETPAPHDTSEAVRAGLRDRLTGFIQEHGEAFLGTAVREDSPRPLPWAGPGPRPVTEKQFTWVNEQLPLVERPLFGKAGCGRCHEAAQPERPRQGDGLPRFEPSRINSRPFLAPGSAGKLASESPQWFPHSLFRHDSHQMLACTECHDKRDSTLTREVALPGIDVCRRCHNGQAGAGARSDCVACHTYHPAAEKRQYKGTLAVPGADGILHKAQP